MTDTLTGSHGRADRLVPTSEASEVVTAWLINSPQWAPLLPMGAAWTEWMLGCCRLRDDVPGLGAPRRQFEGATHEILLMTLDPRHGPYSAQDFWSKPVKFLEPQNVVLQFIAADDEMREMADVIARAIVEGRACPESWRWPGGNQELTRVWLSMCTKTLAHIRGEVHAP